MIGAELWEQQDDGGRDRRREGWSGWAGPGALRLVLS